MGRLLPLPAPTPSRQPNQGGQGGAKVKQHTEANTRSTCHGTPDEQTHEEELAPEHAADKHTFKLQVLIPVCNG